MAGRLLDSFDAYATADILLGHWTGAAKSGSAAYAIGATGRNSTSALRITYNAGSYGYVYKTFDNQATWIVGFALNLSAFSSFTNPADLVALDDGLGTNQVNLRINSSGQLVATRNGTILGTTTNTLVAATFAYVEFKALIDGSVGTIDVHVNGASWLSLTGQNTKATANAYASIVRLGTFATISLTANVTADFDDLYVCDGTGTANNTFLGDLRVQAQHTTGPGHVSAQYTHAGSGSPTSNWGAVSDTTEDGDTTYVTDATAGDEDLYTMSAVTPTSGTIPFIQTMIVARKDDAGTRTIADVISDGTTDHVGASTNLGTTYAQFLTIHETDPVTGSAFTLANVNGRQQGIKTIA